MMRSRGDTWPGRERCGRARTVADRQDRNALLAIRAIAPALGRRRRWTRPPLRPSSLPTRGQRRASAFRSADPVPRLTTHGLRIIRTPPSRRPALRGTPAAKGRAVVAVQAGTAHVGWWQRRCHGSGWRDTQHNRPAWKAAAPAASSVVQSGRSDHAGSIPTTRSGRRGCAVLGPCANTPAITRMTTVLATLRCSSAAGVCGARTQQRACPARSERGAGRGCTAWTADGTGRVQGRGDLQNQRVGRGARQRAVFHERERGRDVHARPGRPAQDGACRSSRLQQHRRVAVVSTDVDIAATRPRAGRRGTAVSYNILGPAPAHDRNAGFWTGDVRLDRTNNRSS